MSERGLKKSIELCPSFNSENFFDCKNSLHSVMPFQLDKQLTREETKWRGNKTKEG